MPQQDTITVGADVVQLTDANVTEVTFVNTGQYVVHVRATVGTTPPDGTSPAGWLPYSPGHGDDRPFATLFRGVSGANRLWAKCFDGGDTEVYVSHA